MKVRSASILSNFWPGSLVSHPSGHPPPFFFNLVLKKIIFGCVGSSLLLCGLSLVVASQGRSWLCAASHCSGFSCCGAQALGCAGSVAVAIAAARSLSCPVVCGIFSEQELNLRLLHWQADS